ncbi:acetylxylan esterase [Alistipes sp.]|uniref:acetylxylan esterase n=1 Tax=Alistipes sp. TaxID=1872444 RepID=UPI0025C4CD9E|nr:acetylxylan esterase [Alistipes sp.]
MKKIAFILLCGCFGVLPGAAQELSFEVLPHADGVFYAPERPAVELLLTNSTAQQGTTCVRLTVETDDHRPLCAFSQQATVPAGAQLPLRFEFQAPAPGFYRCTLAAADSVARFNIGFEPEAIVSLGDAQPDLKEFWEEARAELDAVDPCYEMTLLPEKSSKVREIYLVRMKSLGGETISGYYARPVKRGKYPVIVGYMGYGSKPWCPDPNNPDFAEFVLSVRGQGLNEPENTYGDWITWGLDDKMHYYYRGAFMDLVRAIDFVCSREEVRQDAIFAEGGSQGGAFTLAACALDHRIRAAAPYIPFLSDYPDYFRIVHWPAEPVLRRQKELGIPDEELYRTLSYFDIKNLAPWIECPIMMGVGLQDEVCPPHTNFSGYNRISTEKCYRVFPRCGHDVGPEWWPARTEFFKKYL